MQNYFLYLLLFMNILQIILCQEKSSLSFVIDDTYSMHDDIRQVKENVAQITDIVFYEKASQIQNMVLVTVNDPHTSLMPVTEDRYVFQRYINELQVYGGDDCPEMSMTGLLKSLENSLPGSFIYVFTDASAKDYWKSNEVKNLCQKKQSQIVFVLTGYCSSLHEPGFQVYYDIAAACSGLAFYVPKRDVHEVIKTIKETIRGKKTVITTKKIPPHRYINVPFVIDDQTEYAIITASGTNVELKVYPRQNQETIMWLRNAKVIKLINPAPGTYTARVKGDTETSIYIVGRTDFTFSHGFSKLEPKTIKDTTPQPIANAETFLSISVVDPKHTVNIMYAEILNMDEGIIKDKLHLRQIAKDLYTSIPFKAPSQRFKIAVIGRTVTGKVIRRIAKIPVTPQEPPKPKSKAPIVTIPEGKSTQVEYGQTTKLTCKVSAYPEPKIEWYNSQGTRMNSQSSVLEPPYKHISYLTTADATVNNKYSCKAINDIGTASKTIDVIVKEPFKVQTVLKDITELPYGKRGTLRCDITAAGPMHISWYLHHKTTGASKELVTSDKYTISDNGKTLYINRMDLDMVGKYTCKAVLDKHQNKILIYKTQVKISGLEKPKLLGDPTKAVQIGQPLDVKCTLVKGVPEPTISWQFMAKGSTKFESLPKYNDAGLHIANVDLSNEGSYKCVATNIVDTDEHVTVVTVEYAPSINSDRSKIYRGLEGDVVLKIPCDVVGVPQPTITWKINGAVINQRNSRYSVINGALFIKDPKQSDSKSYTCEARNYIGAVDATFSAIVDSKLEDFGTIREVNVLEGTTFSLECGSDDSSQSVKWYKELEDAGVAGKIYHFEKIPLSLEGNYTCHVSGKNGASTETYAVIVGYLPRFDNPQQDTLVEWSGLSLGDKLDCEFTAKPSAHVIWSFNGKVLSGQNSSELAVPGDWGHYTCNVSNIHGTIERSFDVVSTQCLIHRKPKNVDTMPLILSPAYTWPVLDSTTDYLIVEPKDTVVFSCPTFKDEINSLQNMSAINEITATCVEQDVFKVQDVAYKVSDFQCSQPVQSVVVNKHEKCLGDTSEVIRVGYEVHVFLEAYEVCFDVSKNMALYSRLVMSKSNVGGGNTYSWHKYGALGSASGDTAHTCTHSTSSCCYTNTQLVNAHDVSDGPPQKSTFIHPLNAVPLWLPCAELHEQSPWASIEDTVRSRLDSYDQFVVWSGTHKLQNINGTTIPRYLWKVVRFAADDALAMIYVNGPSPSAADILCRNICADNKIVPWIHKHNDHTYCCQVDEFLSAFGLSSTSVGKGALDKNIPWK